MAGLGAYSSNILIGFGLVSMLVAGIFMLNQTGLQEDAGLFQR